MNIEIRFSKKIEVKHFNDIFFFLKLKYDVINKLQEIKICYKINTKKDCQIRTVSYLIFLLMILMKIRKKELVKIKNLNLQSELFTV